jgi:hypothetical protein
MHAGWNHRVRATCQKVRACLYPGIGQEGTYSQTRQLLSRLGLRMRNSGTAALMSSRVSCTIPTTCPARVRSLQQLLTPGLNNEHKKMNMLHA